MFDTSSYYCRLKLQEFLHIYTYIKCKWNVDNIAVEKHFYISLLDFTRIRKVTFLSQKRGPKGEVFYFLKSEQDMHSFLSLHQCL